MLRNRGGSTLKSRYPKQLVVPDGLRFADLCLGFDPESGNLGYDPEPLECMCAANGLALDEITDDEAMSIFVSWYVQHRRDGGELDTVLESLIETARLGKERGKNVTYVPGHA